MSARLPIASDTLAALCRRHHIRRLSPFGSRLKGTSRPGSGVDLLVEFESQAIVTLLDIARMEQKLSALTDGQSVDLRTAADLNPYFGADVVRMAEPQYVAG
ncbi:MAG: nucleotidyltransferase domain-containing protein [Rubrivivax sp.]|nr:nucleotidyltransferase domain-containing protein [Rubrivivax sp.]